jgi:hypothetical protein
VINEENPENVPLFPIKCNDAKCGLNDSRSRTSASIFPFASNAKCVIVFPSAALVFVSHTYYTRESRACLASCFSRESLSDHRDGSSNRLRTGRAEESSQWKGAHGRLMAVCPTFLSSTEREGVLSRQEPKAGTGHGEGLRPRRGGTTGGKRGAP